MDDFKNNHGNEGDFDEVDEIIDAAEGDVIEVVDPYESEVIEVEIKKKDNVVKKKAEPFKPQAPTKKIMDADFDMFNPSTTVILKKGAGEEDKKDTGNKKAESPVTPPPTAKTPASAPKAPAPASAPKAPVPPAPSKGINLGAAALVGKGHETSAGEATAQVIKSEASEAPKAPPAPKGPVSQPPKGKIKDIDFDDLEPIDYRSNIIKKGEPKKEEPVKKTETTRSAVNPALAGASKASASSSAANPLFAGSGEESSAYSYKKKKGLELFGRPVGIKTLAIAAALVVAVIIAIVVLSSGKKTTIILDNYTTISFEGNSGSAVAVVTIDYDKIVSDYSGIKIKDSRTLKEILEATVSYSLSKSEEISKDEVVYLNWKLDTEGFSNATNAAIKGTQQKQRADKLEVVSNEYDLFANLSVTFAGYSGEGTAELDASKAEFSDVKYSLSKTTGLFNNDEVVVTAAVDGYDDINAYLSKKGLAAKSSEKKYVVTGLSEYEKYDLFANMKVEFEGFDGAGKVTVSGDTGIEGVTLVAEKEVGLFNGDILKINAVDADGKNAKDVLTKNHYSGETTKEVTVEGLKETEEYDAFADIKLKYSGVMPSGRLSIDPADVKISELIFMADKISGLSNGDTINLTIACADGSDPEKVAYEKGFKLTSVKKSVTVDGIGKYMTAIEDIRPEDVNLVDKASRGIMDEVIAGHIDEKTIAAIDYAGMYLQYPKSDDVTLAYNESFGGDIHNRLYMIYKVRISDTSGTFEYYWPIQYANIVISGDGELEINTSAYIAGLAEFSVGGDSYYGYQSLNDFIASCIVPGADTYAAVNNVTK